MSTKTTRNTYGTEISSVYVGKRTAADGSRDEGWKHHLWDVTLTREGQSITFPYRMGLAHERSKCGKPRPSYRAGSTPLCHVRCERAGWVPTPPDLYSVFCSLKADDPQGQTFTDWCDDFGFDTDSRQAMSTYLACQESEVRSRKFFGADWARLIEDEDYQ